MAAKKFVLKADKRTLEGRKIKKLRREGILPINLYGKKIKSQSLQLPKKEFETVFSQVGETKLIELHISQEKEPRHILIHKIQKNPVTDDIIHADLRQVLLTEKIEAEVPFVVVGEAPAVTQGGIMVKMVDAIKVQALPTDLPEKFELDVSKLEKIGDSLSLKNLQYDKTKIKIIEEEEARILVKIEAPTKEEEPVVAPVAEGEAAPAEGAKKEEGKPEEAKSAAAKPEAGKPAAKTPEKK